LRSAEPTKRSPPKAEPDFPEKFGPLWGLFCWFLFRFSLLIKK
jgi:hypothetical protein